MYPIYRVMYPIYRVMYPIYRVMYPIYRVMYPIYRVRGDIKNSINRSLNTLNGMELLIKLLRWFQELNMSGKKVYRNLSVRVVIVSSRFVRVLCNLLIEFGMKRLRYWGVKSFKIL